MSEGGAREILKRLERLPAALRDGSLTNCTVSAMGARILFREPLGVRLRRRRIALRRRLLLGVLGVLVALSVPWLPGGQVQVVVSIAAVLLLLATVDGVRRDLGAVSHPYEYAAIDTLRQEVDLHAPGGLTLTAPLGDIRMFLLIADIEHDRFHVGVVFSDDRILPWLTTSAGFAAHSLTWLFGHLTGRPAMRLIALAPPAPDALEDAEPLEPPLPPG